LRQKSFLAGSLTTSCIVVDFRTHRDLRVYTFDEAVVLLPAVREHSTIAVGFR
jgi:hypothetical protein